MKAPILKYCFIFIVLFCCLSFYACKQGDESDIDDLDLRVPAVSLDEEAQEAVQDWEGYLELEKELALISNTNALNSLYLLDDLATTSNHLSRDIPPAFSTPSILKKIKHIDSKINDFYANVNRSETRERVVERHIETLVKAFDTLNKELNRTL